MQIVTHIENALFSIKWPDCEHNILDGLAIDYQNAEHVRSFFEQNYEGLEYFNQSITAAVQKTLKESRELIEELYQLAENSKNNRSPDLDELFKPLHRKEGFNNSGFHTEFKANGYEAPWVRLYAIKLDTNMYVLTGYGIKLVKQMQDDPSLKKELYKLKEATIFLQENELLN